MKLRLGWGTLGSWLGLHFECGSLDSLGSHGITRVGVGGFPGLKIEIWETRIPLSYALGWDAATSAMASLYRGVRMFSRARFR
jgi:hypothetical protein